MSSTAAQAADSATARNFNPSWIRSAFHGGGSVNSTPRGSTNEEEVDNHVSPPVLCKNRYGREELLVLMPAVARAPEGLANCPLFVPEAREPLAFSQPSELEQRLHLNINSSKAMSSLTPAERMNIAGGGNMNSPNGAGGPNSPQSRIAGNGWTPVKSSSWGRGASQAGGTPNGRGALTRPVGRGAPPVSQTDEGSSPFSQQKFAYRGRGGLTTARGGSTTATNSRAQGLYDPRDPKDRPRNRLRSTSEEADGNEPNNGDGGWSRVQYGRQNSNAWNKDEGGAWGGNADKENVSGSAVKSDSTGTMPEWMDDDDVSDKPEESAGGSFDDEGRYRQPQLSEPVRQAPQRDPPAPSWRPTAVQSQVSQPDSLKERATTSHSAFSGVPFAQPSPTIGQVAPGVPMAPPAAATTPPEFFYLDPSDKERGPFKKDQMEAWFKMGYFADNLKVRRSTDTTYKTLGELKHQNGALTAFDYKEQVFPTVFPPAAAPFGANIFSGNVWNDPLSSMYNPSMFAHNISAAFDAKRMEEEARRMEYEKQAHLRELINRQAEEQAKVILEKEMAFRMKEEEMKRIFEEERIRREMEQLELEKKVQQLEAEKQAREDEERRKMEEEMRRMEEETRREQAKLAEEQRKLEEARRALEEEHRRKEAELARRKADEEERKRRAEAAAEEHRRMLQKKAEEDAARIRQLQAATAAAAAAAKAEEEEKRRAAKDAEKMFNDHDAWNTTSPKNASPSESNEGPWQKATTKKSPVSKPAAAWSTTSQQNTAREKSLREIQEEEERQMLAEQRELARLRKEQESSSAASMQSGMWTGASQRISWNQPAAAPAAHAPSKPAWGSSTTESKPAASPAHWDGPSLQAANKPAAKQATPAKKQPVPAPAKLTPAKNSKDLSSNSFTAWVVKRLKEISHTVDADVLASFLESVENPNEVDDYIEGYLGASKATKEFVKEYLHKRSESRKRKDTDKDDLSSASKAGSGSGTVGHGKKKKGKGQRLIIDGSCLGFRAAADSNRVNQGEIETVGLAPGQKR